MTGTVCDATTSGVSSSSRRREWVAAAANASATAAPTRKPGGGLGHRDQRGADEEQRLRRELGEHRRGRREDVGRDVQGAHDDLGAERERDEHAERGHEERRAGRRATRGAEATRDDATPGAARLPSLLLACLPPGPENDKARAVTSSGPGPPFSRPQHAPPPPRSPRGTRRHTLWRQVFWLPDRPPAAPSRQRAGSGFSQPSSPVTAAGPRRSCTGFPRVALAGTSKRSGC